MFIKLAIISLLLVALVLVAMGIGMLVKKQGRFPDTHVGSNPEMRKRGISCAKSTNIGCTAGNGGCCMNVYE
ncbi:MAG TPA: hypothetical protein P5257_06855 [Bacteroidales bacterium]|nr:hypothetical protein [Bacteroidales bacterium]HRR94093.1 hypothetical protein [Bacteroidales bacterium]HRT89824.1 hypothetical protein [Bacteroidales bacterium]